MIYTNIQFFVVDGRVNFWFSVDFTCSFEGKIVDFVNFFIFFSCYNFRM